MTHSALPLAGRKVAVTRPEQDAGELAELLEAAGATPLKLPLTRVLPPLDAAPLEQALGELESYDWVVFTSARAVRAACSIRADRPWPPRPRIAVVGEATAAEVRRLAGRGPDVSPAGPVGSSVVAAMCGEDALHNARILWPSAERPRPELPRDLAAAGAVLDAPIAYRTVPYPETAAMLAARAAAGEVDAITLTAPSAVACLADARSSDVACVIAVIGPTTAAAARNRGLTVHVAAEKPMMAELVSALERYYAAGGAV